MTEIEIQRMPKQKLKKIVKTKVLDANFKYLKEMKQTHSKMEYLKYDRFETSEYLKSSKFNTEDISLLLALRTRTVRGVRNDFGGLYTDKMCPLGCGDLDTLQNILTCSVLKQHHTSADISTSDIRYEDIFCSDIVKQKQVTELYPSTR